MPPSPTLNPLAHRLAALRRRLRLVTTMRGVSWLVIAVLLTLTVGGLLDFWLHLPGLVRAVFLAATLAGGGCIAYAFLVQPLRTRDDDLSLALRVEEQFPELNDSLASTVQFLQQPDDAADRSASPGLQRAAVEQALERAGACDFGRIVDSRGVRWASLGMIASGTLAALLILWQPALVELALLRLAHPFGSHKWPTKTQLVLDPSTRTRLARGEPFDLRATLYGVIPERAVVRIWFDGSTPSEQSYTIRRNGTLDAGALTARLDSLSVQKSFQFQVVANDAVTDWVQVLVLPPVALVPLDGKPTPQIRLRYPAYTDLRAQDLAPGGSSIEAVLGTQVTLRAATDRPVKHAWIDHQPEQPALRLVGALCTLSARHGGEALALARAGHLVGGQVPVQLQTHGPGTALRAEFVPWASGTYALHMIDEGDLPTTRLFDVRVFADPAPTVALDRPSASHDSLAVLPNATVTVRVRVEDSQYAVRAAWLEYRTARTDPPRVRPLYDHRTYGVALPSLMSAFAATPVPIPRPVLRLRPQGLEIEQRLVLGQLKHPDGRALREGDVVVLQACADDFDDVTSGKQPGRSHEVELRIVGLPAIDALLHHAQEQVQQELQRLREQQREALKRADAVEKQWRNTGTLRPEDLDNLLQAEQLQQQIRGRVGTKEEGLRAEAARIQQMLRDNQLPRSGTHERMELVERELDRLARQELEQIEPLLTEARKENELAQEKPKPDPKSRGSLGKAVQHQEEVERTLGELLAELDSHSSSRQARAETKALLQEERKLSAETDKLSKQVPAGLKPDAARAEERLKPEDKAELEKTADQQARLAEQARQLLDKMDRIAAAKHAEADAKTEQSKEKARLAEEKTAQAEKEREDNPAQAQKLADEARSLRKEAETLEDAAAALNDEAQALEKAAAEGRKGDVKNQMQQAGEHIKGNQLGKAGQEQQRSTEALEKMTKALEDRRQEELDQLTKKLKKAEQELARLVEEQEKLRKKVKEAQALDDPKEREEELKRLAREQEKLRKEAREMAQTLSRMRAGKSSQAMRDAGGQMDQAGQQLERGDNADEQQEDALDRLQDAMEDLQDAREQVEEELAREKLFKIAEQLKLLKERQEALLPDTERIHREVLQQKQWQLALLRSLNRQADAQQGLGEETAKLADTKLKDADVFAHILRKSAKAMEQAAETIKERVDKAKDRVDDKLDVQAEEAAYEKTLKLQKDAVALIDRLLDALKPDEGMRMRGGKPGSGQGSKSGPEGDGIPEVAQLKLLKALQQDVNKRTEEFGRSNPDAAKLTAEQKKELTEIQKDQAVISDLLDKLTAPDEAEGGKP